MVEVVVLWMPSIDRLTRNQMKAATRDWRLQWQRMLDERVYSNRSALAHGEGVSPTAVTQGLQKLASIWVEGWRFGRFPEAPCRG
jgi:hypothetical protein